VYIVPYVFSLYGFLRSIVYCVYTLCVYYGLYRYSVTVYRDIADSFDYERCWFCGH
jgi:hypothetical protein